MIEVLTIAIPIGFAVALVGLTAILLHLIRSQQNPKHHSPKPSYKRIPVIHPKRTWSSVPSAAPPPPLPLQTRLNLSESRRQRKDPTSPIKRNSPAASSPAVPATPKTRSPAHAFGHTLKPHPLTPQLLSLVQGDRSLATRLLSQCKQKHPGNSESWYYEKVIWDLKRDRH